jgi:hypothetical protein
MLGGLGLLFEEGEIDKMRNHIMDLYADRAKGIEMGIKLRERCLAIFSTRALNDDLYQLLTSLEKH